MTQKTKKASILAFTLIMLGILLAAGLSLMGATLTNQRVAMEAGDSIQALQSAETGTDIAISLLSNASSSDSIQTVFSDSTKFTISGNQISGTTARGGYTLVFLDDDGNELPPSTGTVSNVESVKSVGNFANTNRAVEVALADDCIGDYCVLKSSNDEDMDCEEVKGWMKDDDFIPLMLRCDLSPSLYSFYAVRQVGISNNEIDFTVTDSYSLGTGLFTCYFNSASHAEDVLMKRTGLVTGQNGHCTGGWKLYGPSYPAVP